MILENFEFIFKKNKNFMYNELIYFYCLLKIIFMILKN